MKWMVGYQLCENSDFVDTIIELKNSIKEVYFSFGNLPNGRNTALVHKNLSEWQAREKQIGDLNRLNEAGLSFNLLLNGNCYGAHSLSKKFLGSLCDIVDDLKYQYRLVSVTTTSPVIARCLKQNFPDLEIRASVNMEIGTIEGMEYLSNCFDSFYMKRECNRDLAQIEKLYSWSEKNNKKLYMLANSGCLNNCSARQFHDNLVAHENEISEMDNAVNFHGICADYLSRENDKSVLLSRLNFVRPEDIKLYDRYFEAAKLATRVTRYPSQILRAYANGHYSGNLLDLLEPDHAERLYPQVLENNRIPKDFGQKVLTCSHNCSECGYCKEVFNNAKLCLNNGGILDVDKCYD